MTHRGLERAPRTNAHAPRVVAYAAAPSALVVLLVSLHFGVVARQPVWVYVAALAGAMAAARLVEGFPDTPPGSLRLHLRVVAHVAAVTTVIYLSGWGPALGLTYVFAALATVEQSGASAWRASLGWSLASCTVGQALVVAGWAPSFLEPSRAIAIGLIGAFGFAIVIRMAGAIAEHKEQAEAALADRALHDSLTGLPNRVLLVDRLTQALDRGRRREVAPAVLFLDLDKFKAVNDTLGHHAGDSLLCQVADRLGRVLRSTDTLSRLGGDEFVIVCEEPGDPECVTRIVHRIRSVFDEPFILGGHEVRITASVGTACAVDGSTPERLLTEADASMYFAKTNRRDKDGSDGSSEFEHDRGFFRAVLESTLEGVVVFNAVGEIEFANGRFAQIIGSPVADLVGRSWRDLVFPEDAELHRRLAEERGLGLTPRHELRLRRADGTEVWCTISTTPLVGSTGTRFVSLSHEVAPPKPEDRAGRVRGAMATG